MDRHRGRGLRHGGGDEDGGATGIQAGARTHHQDSVMAPASLAMDSTWAGHGRQAKLLSAF